MTAKRCFRLAVAVVTFAAMATGAMAQATAPAAAPAAPKAKAAGSGGDGDLRRRVQQLEEQIVDMQVVIGTLESLARSGGAAPAPRVVAPVGGGGADAARIDALDMQVRALTSQIEQLQSGRGGTSAPAYSAAPAQPAAPSTFGSTTLNAGEGDPIGGLIAQDQPVPARPSAAPPAMAATDPVATGDPKQAYERAYGFLLQQEYGAAQAGFIEFLKVYPRDSLVPNALYWLGETHYVQRNYADAAEAFDLVTQGYGNSPKAADSMLKRGMALAALGKKQDACGVLGQMPGKYPSAPPHLKSKADSERQRIGCP
ncbi:MAG: tol-pal system protein YbgF [Hyphomicrobium sp. 32-62-53]|nr:MAG: tol-pal system protein YbgF [Hyphomicrobium sp. 12-62-95]OYX98298.1 MAG: tol-pal system protein YbgF [Hyphomicrobium sp. 32-62-53]